MTWSSRLYTTIALSEAQIQPCNIRQRVVSYEETSERTFAFAKAIVKMMHTDISAGRGAS